MKHIYPQIEKLLRSNVALALLCVISIGVLVLVLRGKPQTSRLGVTQTSVSQNTGSTPSYLPGMEVTQQMLNGSPLKNMPAPTSFKSFTYHMGDSVSVSSTCADVYYVVIVYPEDIDYRIDPLSARYNSATKCVRGKIYKEALDLDGKGLVEAQKYYLIHASQGAKGSWYNPY